MSYGTPYRPIGMNEDPGLCLQGKLAKPYMERKVGDKLTLSVEATITGIEKSEGFGEVRLAINTIQSDEENYRDMDSKEFEKKVAKNRGY